MSGHTWSPIEWRIVCHQGLHLLPTLLPHLFGGHRHTVQCNLNGQVLRELSVAPCHPCFKYGRLRTLSYLGFLRTPGY